MATCNYRDNIYGYRISEPTFEIGCDIHFYKLRCEVCKSDIEVRNLRYRQPSIMKTQCPCTALGIGYPCSLRFSLQSRPSAQVPWLLPVAHDFTPWADFPLIKYCAYDTTNMSQLQLKKTWFVMSSTLSDKPWEPKISCTASIIFNGHLRECLMWKKLYQDGMWW